MTHDIVPPRLNSKPYIHLPSQWKRCSHTCGYSPQCGFNWNKHLVVHLTIAPKQSCPPLLIWRVAAFSSTPSQHSGRARWHMAYTWSSKSLVWRTASKPPKHFLICKKSHFCGVVETTTIMFGVLYCESFGVVPITSHSTSYRQVLSIGLLEFQNSLYVGVLWVP